MPSSRALASRRTPPVVRALAAALAVAGVSAAPAAPDEPVVRLGQPLSAAAAAQGDPAVFPDGRGLPPGRGDAVAGRRVYDARCAACHGEGGRGGSSGRLTGRGPIADHANPERTIGQYWPYATTVFDYVRRAMPLDAPGTLSDDELYAVTAYLLFANGIVAEDAGLDAATLPAVRMPHRDGFVRGDRPPAGAR